MHALERAAIAVRRSRILRETESLWSALRPAYLGLLAQVGRRGLERNINGMDRLRVAPELYVLSETYEPDVWRTVMEEVRAGDVVADVGAYLGLYTVALAQRAGPAGRVYAFEPNRETIDLLRRQIALNGVASRVTVLHCAVGERSGRVCFVHGRGSESHVGPEESERQEWVRAVTLDEVFARGRLDLLKLDVEGFEEHVLRGAAGLLRDPRRAPRAIFIEVHPFAWERFGVCSASLLCLLESCGYEVLDLNGRRICAVTQYGEIVARRRRTATRKGSSPAA